MIQASRNGKVSMERLKGYLERRVKIEMISVCGVQTVDCVLNEVKDFDYIRYTPAGRGVSRSSFGFMQFVGTGTAIRRIWLGDQLIYDNSLNFKEKTYAPLSDTDLKKLRITTFGRRDAAMIDEDAYLKALGTPIKLRQESLAAEKRQLEEAEYGQPKTD